jgi:imidazolonepropionase-like amidohydrolase
MMRLRSIRLLAVAGILSAAPAFAGADFDAWKNAMPAQPDSLVVRHATIWTSGPQGRLENADLLIHKGKIVSVGQHLSVPAGTVEIDGTGKHVTPGVIDPHSHSDIVGDVNEGTNIITSEVRIQDVVNSESIAVYRELAGGVTCVNLLHGSANSIGGQNQVIKLRWGATPDEMIFASAPPGIKFALGENPKQSNWGNGAGHRFPQSRQGVEQSIRERFAAARDYERRWNDYKKNPKGDVVPPRRDLQLDAIVEILNGKRLVHAHSYRADEMLMLMRLAEEYGFRVATLQHVLEGYKIADEIAKHGAGASTFSDWWAYKQEVHDAIPYNGAIMWERGVTVTFNSDSSELARHLNLEAAKAVRYGNVPEVEAFKFATINGAKQLHIDQWVGSLEAGKDADFVIWSASPLSSYGLAEQTWVDGRKYFDRADDLKHRDALVTERNALIAKVKASEKKGKDDKDKDKDKKSDAPAKPAYLQWESNSDESSPFESGRAGAEGDNR